MDKLSIPFYHIKNASKHPIFYHSIPKQIFQ